MALFCWAIYIGLRENAQDFLVFSRRAPFVLVLFSIVATWVGVGTTVVTAASAYESGISLGLIACLGGVLGSIGAAIFAPRLKAFGDRFNAHTIGDFFLIRYSNGGRLMAGALITIVYSLLTAAQLVGLATLLKVWTGLPVEVVIIFAAFSTVAYTAFAGIKSDFYTDIIHFIVMAIVLFVILLPLTLDKIGGLHGLLRLPHTYFDPFSYGGPALFIAGMIFGAGSVFVTMELWQRVYASTTGRAARISLAVAILLIVLFYAVSTVLGMSAKLLLPNLPNRDFALFAMMKEYLPTGMLGLGMSGFMAIILSTLNSTLMVTSATFTKDFWCGALNKSADDQKALLSVGRISTFVSGAIGLGIALILPDLVALSVNGMFMLLIILPAIAGGFFWRRATATAATLSVFAGALVTVIFLKIDAGIAFVPGFLTSLLVFVIGSLVTEHSIEENIGVVSMWRGKAEIPSMHEGDVHDLR
jgi:SSS family solute:Na+ symporter